MPVFSNLTHLTHLMARTYKDQRKFNQKQAIRSGFVDVSYDTGNLKDYKNLKSLMRLMDAVTD